MIGFVCDEELLAVRPAVVPNVIIVILDTKNCNSLWSHNAVWDPWKLLHVHLTCVRPDDIHLANGFVVKICYEDGAIYVT
jgi:hypothetical protein